MRPTTMIAMEKVSRPSGERGRRRGGLGGAGGGGGVGEKGPYGANAVGVDMAPPEGVSVGLVADGVAADHAVVGSAGWGRRRSRRTSTAATTTSATPGSPGLNRSLKLTPKEISTM